MPRFHNLRIVAHRDGEHALIGWVNVDTRLGEVKFAGQMGDVAVWRHSYHESGVRTYYPLPDVVVERAPAGPPAGQFVGRERLAMRKMPLGAATWEYRPKPRHTNLIVGATDVCEVDVWIIEAGRHDLVESTIAGYPHVLRTALLDECDPMVLAVAWSFPSDFLEEIGPTHLHSMASPYPTGRATTIGDAAR